MIDLSEILYTFLTSFILNIKMDFNSYNFTKRYRCSIDSVTCAINR